ncbi:MAG: helix-turn-helix domain-containing protein [Nitrosotalea sp.]
MTYVKKIPISKNKVLQKGPLESVFPGSTSKILDFLATFKDWDYSVSDIAKNSGVSFKTALNEIKNLEQQGVVSRKRTVGKAIMYKLNLDSKQGFYIDKLVFEIATKRSLESSTTKNKTAKVTV